MKIKENLYRTPAIKTRSNITEIDWNTLLGLDFTKELLLSDFPTRAVRDALELQILLKKTPFISRNDCINTVRDCIIKYGHFSLRSNMKIESIRNYHALYSVSAFLDDIKKMQSKMEINRKHSIDKFKQDDSLCVIKQSKYDSSIISLYRYRYSFTLPYPEYSFDGRFYIEYTTVLSRLNHATDSVPVIDSAFSKQTDSFSLFTIWEKLIFYYRKYNKSLDSFPFTWKLWPVPLKNDDNEDNNASNNDNNDDINTNIDSNNSSSNSSISSDSSTNSDYEDSNAIISKIIKHSPKKTFK